MIKSLRYCQKNKGLTIYTRVIPSNHCHLIVQSKKENVSDIIRDFKKHTAKAIYQSIQSNTKESRREWLLKTLTHNDKIWFWGKGHSGEEIFSEAFFSKRNLSLSMYLTM